MDLSHTFTVPTDVETTWAHFQDIAALAQCFPGAQVTSAEGDTFQGTVKVKLGPIALVYTGSGTFVDKDDDAHRFVVDAKGKDKRGNGTAGAKVTLSMATSGSGGTDVEVLTDLAVTGKPAQFGRGVMQDVSDKLLGQFVTCLEDRLGEDQAPGPASEPAPEGASLAAVATGASEPPSPAEPGTTTTEQPVVRAVPDPAPGAGAGSHRGRPAQDDALDLGAAVIPVLLKGYWKQGAAGLGLVALLVWLVGRRR